MKLRFCVICGTNKNLEHHHIIPVAKGGDDHPHNFITLCDEHHAMIHQIRPGAWNNRKKLVQIGREKALANGVKFGMKPKYEHLYPTITEMYLQWNGYGTIGREVGIARGSVASIIKRLGIERGPQPLKNPLEKKYRKLKNGQYKLFEMRDLK